jgi:hypothetical protein
MPVTGQEQARRLVELSQQHSRTGGCRNVGSAIIPYCNGIMSTQFFVLPTGETVCRQTRGYGSGIAAEFVRELPKKSLI